VVVPGSMPRMIAINLWKRNRSNILFGINALASDIEPDMIVSYWESFKKILDF
jgi:hypothetical protein